MCVMLSFSNESDAWTCQETKVATEIRLEHVSEPLATYFRKSIPGVFSVQLTLNQ